MQERRETRIVAVAPSAWRSKTDVRAKARARSCTLKGGLESKVLQTLLTNALKSVKTDRACTFVSFLMLEVR